MPVRRSIIDRSRGVQLAGGGLDRRPFRPGTCPFTARFAIWAARVRTGSTPARPAPGGDRARLPERTRRRRTEREGRQDASRRRAVMRRAVTHRSADRRPPVARPATMRCTRGADRPLRPARTGPVRRVAECRWRAGAPTCGTPSAGRPRHHRPPRGGERRALIRRCGRRPPTARLPPARSPPYGLSRTVRPAAPPGRSSAVPPDAPANWRSPCGYRQSGTPGTSARVKDQPSRTDGQPRRCPKEFATALTGFPLTPTESLRTRR